MQLRPGTATEAGVHPDRVKHLSSMLQKWITEGFTHALLALAARRGVIFLDEAIGRVDHEPDSPNVSPNTLFGLASVSKSFTATAIMLLVEEGRIGLNRPVGTYIPEFTGPNKGAIWVRHLLTHTSGLRDADIELTKAAVGTKIVLPPFEPTEYPPLQKELHHVYRLPVWRTPGTYFNYSNLGYELLGEIVRRVSGQSFHDFTRERIFLPIGMHNTYFSVPDKLRSRLIQDHIAPFGWDNVTSPCAAGCAFSTTMDIARFGQTFLNGGCYGDFHLLSPASVLEMTSHQIPGIPRKLPKGETSPAPGFGWYRFSEANLPRLPSLWSPQSYANTGASGAFLWVDPTYELVGVFLFTKVKEAIWPYDAFVDAVTAAVNQGP